MISSVSRDSVLAAIEECDRAGRESFLAWHGFGRATAYEVVHRGRRYPSKAILGVAAGRELGREPLRPTEFSGGAEHSARVLVRLGFTVRHGARPLTLDDVAIPRRLSLRELAADLRLYVCRPTNARSVAACYEHDFGVLLSPLSVRSKGGIDDMSGHTKPLPGLPYVLDNGVWSCHQAGVDWDDEPLRRLLERLGGGEGRPAPGFVVAPDIIGGGEDSIAFSLDWLASHRADTPSAKWLLAVQDGMTVERVREVLLEHRLAGVFVGGSTRWKWETVHVWARLALEMPEIRVHVGRVNSLRRAMLCRDLGVHSCDGSSVTRYSINAPKMARAADGDDLPILSLAERRGLEQATVALRGAKAAIAGREFYLTLGGEP